MVKEHSRQILIKEMGRIDKEIVEAKKQKKARESELERIQNDLKGINEKLNTLIAQKKDMEDDVGALRSGEGV